MKTRLSDELTMLTTRLMMCGSKREIINISGEFGKLIERVIEQENNTYTTLDKSVTATIKFTKDEVANMAKTFKKEFIANGLVARVIKRPSGKNSFLYEIRYRRNGYNISASSTDLNEAKQKFLAKTIPGEIEKYWCIERITSLPTTFSTFGHYFFEIKRKGTVAEETYKNDLSRFKKYLVPHFQEISLLKITLPMCQELINSLIEAEKFKTAAEIRSLMNLIFRFAIDNHIITKNPAAALIVEAYEMESGYALSVDEEIKLFHGLTEHNFKVAVSLCLYCGLRPNELSSASIDGNFIKAVNSKRHKKKKKKNAAESREYKWIPIIDKLRCFIKDGIPELPSPQLIRRRLKDVLPDHKLYDCRTTFQTRCRSFNIEENALKAMMGHSFGRLGNAYTDVEQLKPYLLKEAEKLNKW